MTNQDYTEQTLIEKPAIKLFKQLGYDHMNCYHESVGEDCDLGRSDRSGVVLKDRLKESMERLNPDVSEAVLDMAVEKLTKSRKLTSLVKANQDVYELLKKGVDIVIEDDEEEVEREERVQVIDWDNPENNDFFLASQFWVTGDMYQRRPDLVGFVNGLPLVLVELKNQDKDLKEAYDNNLKDYKDTIPKLFYYNAAVILSNGSEAKVGTLSSSWNHFDEWKRIENEDEQPKVSMEKMIRGICRPDRLIDILENFIMFDSSSSELTKIISKNHQYLGVNNAVESFENREENDGRLGVFWHTQGSGKSYSMIFFSRKILRKYPGDYTFVIITDRTALDDQIYGNFAACGAIDSPEEAVRADSIDHLKELLSGNNRFVFTTIHKFQTDDDEDKFPELTDRDDVIVMTDEAHRTQYDVLAMNMRRALPNANFLGFTGTPLLAEEEKTRQVFGDYVSIYDFQQSIEDNATLPIYYENRIPQLQLSNEELNEDLEKLVEEAHLGREEEEKLSREFSREYNLITHEDRLDKVAADIAEHFINRGFMGKGMVVCIDKETTVEMHDKVKKHWLKQKELLKSKLSTASKREQKEIQEKLDYMNEIEMSVIVSPEQNEIAKFEELGLDIETHRRKMNNQNMKKRFKDPDDPFALAFVCSMWLTGFDVPVLSTMYIDKPMKNHTLMQAIARTNRVYENKENGLIVDYLGVFRNLEKALSLYTQKEDVDITPVQQKEELVDRLEQEVQEMDDFCEEHNIDIDKIISSEDMEKIEALEEAVDKVVAKEEIKNEFLNRESNVRSLFDAVLPDEAADEFRDKKDALHAVAKKIRSMEREDVDISEVKQDLEELINRSIDVEDYVIHDPIGKKDLSEINFDKVREEFSESEQKNTEAEKLKNNLEDKIEDMTKKNPERIDYKERLEKLIEEYNNNAYNVEQYFQKLMDFAEELNEEEQRAAKEGLNEEELALFDLLYKENLSQEEEEEVKSVAKELLDKLKKNALIDEWKTTQRRRANVKSTISRVLWSDLPRSYEKEILKEKENDIYEHIYRAYDSAEESVYA